MTTLEQHLAALRAQVDQHLDHVTQLDADCPDRLREAIRYSLLAKGKRLRPLLVLLACDAVGGDISAALPAASAVEMIHAYSLIHDDLPAMDDDDLRRGRPTCHVQFDEATAILAGDALQPLAFELLARDIQPPAQAARCCLVLAQAAGPSALVGGQAADLQAEHELGTVEKLAAIHRRKTGAMIRVSVVLGGLCGNAADWQLDALKKYGEAIGLAFQIVDDVLDVTSSDQQMGKRTGKDQDRGKLTYPGLIGLDASQQKATELIAQAKQAASLLGPGAERLHELADFVLERSH